MIEPNDLRRPVAIAAVAVALLSACARSAFASTAAERCAAAQLDATARMIVETGECRLRTVGFGLAAETACLDRASARLVAAFENAEARGSCARVGSADAVAARIASVGAEAEVNLFSGQSADACAAAKLRASGRMGARAIACHARSVRRDVALREACSERASKLLAQAFERAESVREGCSPAQDAAEIGSLLARLASDLQALLVAGTPLPDTVPDGLTAEISGGEVHLEWTGPDPASDHTHVRVLRKLNGAPTGPRDPAATVVFFGVASSASDLVTRLLPDVPEASRTYHYAAFGCTPGATCEASGSTISIVPTATQVLRAGGYAIYFRHASATVCFDRLDLGPAATTTLPGWWKSCSTDCPAGGMGAATARQLDATGISQASGIGVAIDVRGIPFARVAASEFCRAVQTAQLMDLGPPIEERPDLTFSVYADEPNRCTNILALLAEAPTAGSNSAFVGHAGLAMHPECAPFNQLPMGSAAVFKPDGAGGSEMVTVIDATEWATLP